MTITSEAVGMSARAGLSRAAVIVIVAAGVVGSAVPAVANTTAINLSGTTLVVTGSPGADKPTVDFDVDDSTLRIVDAGGVPTNVPAQCVKVGDTTVKCPSSVTQLQLSLGAGADQPTLGVCTSTMTVDLGEGDNSLMVPGCGPGTAFSVVAGGGADTVSAPGAVATPITALLGAGADTFTGGGGAETVTGGPGQDTLAGGLGDDTIYARDGEVDHISCGAGVDTVQIDAIDVLDDQGCENVDRPAAAPVPAPPGFTYTTVGKSRITKGTAVAVSCSAACTIRATITISAAAAKKLGLPKKPLGVGSGTGALITPGTVSVKVKSFRKARTKLEDVRRTRATLTITVTGANGAAAVQEQAITLKQ